jgi:hypothetical protein
VLVNFTDGKAVEAEDWYVEAEPSA